MSIQLSWPGGSFSDCELIIFDKDGTLVDFKSVWLNMAAARAQYLANQLSTNSAELFSWRNRFLRALGVHPETGDISLLGPIVTLSFESQSYCLASLLHSLLPDKFTWPQALKLTDTAIDWALKQNDPALLAEPISGAFEFVKKAAKLKVKMAMITSDASDNARRTLSRFGVLDHFSEVYGSDMPPAKPSSRAVTKLCKELGIPLEKTILIGDTTNDITMSLGAGIPVLCLEGVGKREDLLKIGATGVISKWKQLEIQPFEAQETKPSTTKKTSASSNGSGTSKTTSKKPTASSGNYILRTDGASRGNPGKASIGFVLYDDKGKKIKAYGEPIGVATNNVAEYSALIKGLEAVLESPGKNLKIELDSDLIVKQIQGKYKVKEANMVKLHAKAVKLIEKIPGNFEIMHIPRAANFEADQLCNQALDLKRVV